jgi:hypothetical protein
VRNLALGLGHKPPRLKGADKDKRNGEQFKSLEVCLRPLKFLLGRRKTMSSRKTGIALGLAGVVALSAITPSMASMPTAVAAIKTMPSTNTIDVRWGWWPGIGVGIGLGLLGAAIASPYYYGYGYPYGYGGYYGGYGYPYGGYGYPYAYGGYGYPYAYSGYRYPYGYGYYGGYASPYAGYYAMPIRRSTVVRHYRYHH